MFLPRWEGKGTGGRRISVLPQGGWGSASPAAPVQKQNDPSNNLFEIQRPLTSTARERRASGLGFRASRLGLRVITFKIKPPQQEPPKNKPRSPSKRVSDPSKRCRPTGTRPDIKLIHAPRFPPRKPAQAQPQSKQYTTPSGLFGTSAGQEPGLPRPRRETTGTCCLQPLSRDRAA